MLNDLIRKINWLERELERLKTVENKRATPVGCRVYRSTTQSINNNSIVPLSFDTEVYDTGACWAIANPTKLYAPFAGYYLAGGNWSLAAADVDAANRMGLLIRANGTVLLGFNEVHTISGVSVIVGACTGMFYLAAGEYVELCAYHVMGVAENAQAATATNQYFNNGWMVKL